MSEEEIERLRNELSELEDESYKELRRQMDLLAADETMDDAQKEAFYAKIREELRMMSDKVEKLTSVRPTLFRPPYGDYNNLVIQTARDKGYEAVQWSVDSLDWKNISPEDMIRRAGDVQSGDIILFHNDSQYLLDALPTLLKSYQEKGLKMVKVSEILLEGETTIDVQGKQHPTAVQDTSKER